MNIQINETADGQFEVVRMQPVVVAVIADRGLAEQFKLLLENNDVETTAVKSLPAPQTKAPEPNKQSAAPPASGNDEIDWEAAYKRIAAGELVKDVAADIGVPFPSLRGKWVAYAKKLKSDAPAPVAPVDRTTVEDATTTPGAALPATVGDNSPSAVIQRAKANLGDDDPKCVTCQTRFKQTPDNLDQCARCRHV